MGPIINLTYSDPALIKIAERLRIGALRHPGGTVANYWSLENGTYVGENGSNCKGDHWNYCTYQERIDMHPEKTFTPENFMKGIGGSCLSKKGPIWDLNVLTLTEEDAKK